MKSKKLKTDKQPDGPAGQQVDIEGISRSSYLYPLDQQPESSNQQAMPDNEDLGTNADGTNPGTEYKSPKNKS